MQEISIDELAGIDIRVGRVVAAFPFPEGRSSTHILQIELGDELGVRKSLAKLAPNYGHAELAGRQVLCVVNLPARQIGGHCSEVLTLGVPDEQNNVVLICPETDVPLGGRVY